jgi:hypothetical protein
MAALRYHGPDTATGLAERLGTNTGQTSYHLRQLAAAGLVEDDPERSNGRDRSWRARHGSTTWDATEYEGDPDSEAAAAWLLRHHASLVAGWVQDWLDERDAWSQEWRSTADQSDYVLHLAPDGMQALLDEVHEVIRKHRDAAPAPEDAPEGSEDVAVLLQAFPVREPRL